MKKRIDDKVKKYLSTNEILEMKNKFFNKTHYGDGETDITPVIQSILQRIRDNSEDKQLKLDSIFEILLLILQYY